MCLGGSRPQIAAERRPRDAGSRPVSGVVQRKSQPLRQLAAALLLAHRLRRACPPERCVERRWAIVELARSPRWGRFPFHRSRAPGLTELKVEAQSELVAAPEKPWMSSNYAIPVEAPPLNSALRGHCGVELLGSHRVADLLPHSLPAASV